MVDYEALYTQFRSGRMGDFYTLMYPGLVTFAARILGDGLGLMAEDCVQEAVMAAYLHLDDITGAAHWRWYLAQSVRHRALNVLRRHGRTAGMAACPAATVAPDECEPDVSQFLIRQETLDTLFAAIDRLPPQYREIFDLSFEQGLKTRQIAQMLDVAEITVKKRRARMLGLLRSWLDADDYTLLLALLAIC